MQKAVQKLALLTLSGTLAYSQTATPPAATPASRPTAATYITKDDVDAVLKSQPLGDHDIKSVDVGKLNLSVGVVSRAASKPSADGSVNVLAHHHQTETYIIIEGSGTLVTGGDTYDGRETPPTSMMYTTYNGPTTQGKTKNGVRRVVNVGDIVIIPPDVNHGWAEIPVHVTYLSVRPDPDRQLPAGYVFPALRK